MDCLTSDRSKTINNMRLINTVFLLTITFSLFGQEESNDSLPIFVIVDQPTEFPGGQSKFKEYVANNLRHPTKKEKHGKIYVMFVIDTTGQVLTSKTKILRPKNETLSEEIHKLYDTEIIRVVNESPAWIPAQQRGKRVRQQWTLPISF